MTIRIVLLRAVFRDLNEESLADKYNPREATYEIRPPVQRLDDSFRESLAGRLYRARLPTFKAVSTSKIRGSVTIGDQALSTNENGFVRHSRDLPVCFVQMDDLHLTMGLQQRRHAAKDFRRTPLPKRDLVPANGLDGHCRNRHRRLSDAQRADRA
jgi:hypothetical protein